MLMARQELAARPQTVVARVGAGAVVLIEGARTEPPEVAEVDVCTDCRTDLGLVGEAWPSLCMNCYERRMERRQNCRRRAGTIDRIRTK